jgi:hypothetical protein
VAAARGNGGVRIGIQEDGVGFPSDVKGHLGLTLDPKFCVSAQRRTPHRIGERDIDSFDRSRSGCITHLADACRTSCMIDKASPKAWVIRATRQCCGKPPAIEIYDVAIPGAADAVAAVRRECGVGPDTIVATVAELPSGTDLRNGEVLSR